MAFMEYIATDLVQQIVNQVHVMMSLATVLRDVQVVSMVHTVKTPVHQTVIPSSVMRKQAIVILDALLVSLVISAVNHVLLTVWAVANKPAVLVLSVNKVSLLENVTRLALHIVRVVVIKLKESVTMAVS